MSDEATTGGSVPEPAPGQAEPLPQQATAGTQLRQAREAAGVELPALAVALKVSVKKLEALEADRLDLLPDAVFVRALASSVCRNLKIDAAPILQQLPGTTVPRLQYDQAGLNTPFQAPGDVSKIPFWDRLSRPMVLAAMAVLMGALVLIFLPSTEQRADLGVIVSRSVSATPERVEVPEPEPAALAPAETKAKPAKSPAAATVAEKPVANEKPPAADKSPPPEKAVAVAAASPAANTGGVQDAPAPVKRKYASTGIVVFRTQGPSWIEVTDGNGAIQLSRLVEPGEVIGASGPLPLKVTVGAADLTEVEVRGKPYSLESVTRQNVAHFEVQ